MPFPFSIEICRELDNTFILKLQAQKGCLEHQIISSVGEIIQLQFESGEIFQTKNDGWNVMQETHITISKKTTKI